MLVKYNPHRYRGLFHPNAHYPASRIYGDCSNRYSPKVDVYEDKDNLYIELEIPGVSKKNMEIKIVEGNILLIKGNKAEKEKEVEKSWRSERFYGEFKRSFKLPDYLDPEKITAKMENGILTLSMPKKEEAKPKEINIDFN